MAVSISLYNHTTRRFADGSNAAGDTYKVKLLSAATFDAAHATLAATGGTETVSGSGYSTGGATLSNVAITTVTTNDAKLDADDVIWPASGGSIAAAYAILFNSSDADSPPIAFIDFGGLEVADDGTNFRLAWNAGGILSWTTA